LSNNGKFSTTLLARKGKQKKEKDQHDDGNNPPKFGNPTRGFAGRLKPFVFQEFLVVERVIRDVGAAEVCVFAPARRLIGPAFRTGLSSPWNFRSAEGAFGRWS
jgi:hypothetical protein